MYFFLEQHYVNRTGGFAVPQAQWAPSLRQWASRYSCGNNVRGFRKAMPRILEGMYDTYSMGVYRPQSMFLRNGDGAIGVEPVRFERLRVDTVAAIESSGAPVPSGLRSSIMSSRKTNSSGHADYRDCYNDSLRKLVARYERWIVDTFEYAF